jgi:hypothetical protein
MAASDVSGLDTSWTLFAFKAPLLTPHQHTARQVLQTTIAANTPSFSAVRAIRTLCTPDAPSGMTKTEISVEVFNRHASSADIDEALRLLLGLGMVYCLVEASGGAPIHAGFSSPKPAKKANKVAMQPSYFAQFAVLDGNGCASIATLTISVTKRRNDSF